MKTIIYHIQDREAGNVIEHFNNLATAKNALADYEAADIASQTFTPDFYEIVAVENNSQHSPKNKYMAQIYYSKSRLKNQGAARLFTANTADTALKLATKSLVDIAIIAIFENQLEYPKFNWVEISIHHFNKQNNK